MNEERQALDDLVSSPGWALLKAHVDGEWGAVAFGQKIAATIGSRDLDPQTAVQQLQQATVAQREVLRVLLWPEERIKALKAAKLDGVPMQRGGY